MSHRPARILIATTNPAKQERLRWLLEGLGIALVSPGELRIAVDAPEEGGDHRAIAERKALAWSKAAGIAAIASDGGLVIPALGERWDALRTGRFAGPGAGDRARLDRLLELMRPLAGGQREAYWTEAAAVAEAGRVLASWQAESARGLIAPSYDPARIIPGFWAFSVWLLPQRGRTYAELSPAERDRLDDHWARLRERVRAFFGAPG